jgi:hypothetical protein
VELTFELYDLLALGDHYNSKVILFNPSTMESHLISEELPIKKKHRFTRELKPAKSDEEANIFSLPLSPIKIVEQAKLKSPSKYVRNIQNLTKVYVPSQPHIDPTLRKSLYIREATHALAGISKKSFKRKHCCKEDANSVKKHKSSSSSNACSKAAVRLSSSTAVVRPPSAGGKTLSPSPTCSQVLKTVQRCSSNGGPRHYPSCPKTNKYFSCAEPELITPFCSTKQLVKNQQECQDEGQKDNINIALESIISGQAGEVISSHGSFSGKTLVLMKQDSNLIGLERESLFKHIEELVMIWRFSGKRDDTVQLSDFLRLQLDFAENAIADDERYFRLKFALSQQMNKKY